MRFFFLLLLTTSVNAQSGFNQLSLDSIFDPSFEAKGVPAVHWLPFSGEYAILEAASESGQKDIVRYNAATGEKKLWVPASRLVFPATAAPVKIDQISWSDNATRVLIFTNVGEDQVGERTGDYWVYDIPVNAWYKLGKQFPSQKLKAGRFSPGGNKISYVYENDIYVDDISSNTTARLTYDGSDNVRNAQMKGCNMSMIHLRYQHLVKGRDGYSWSRDGKHIAYVQLNMEGVPDFYMINNTETLYPQIIKFPYVKVGQRMPAFRVGVVDVTNGSKRWLEVPGDASEDYLWQMEWLGNSGELMLQVMNRLQQKMQMMVVAAGDSIARVVHTYEDTAWVEPNNVYWLEDGRKFTWLSEEDGWQRMYVYSRKGERLHALTPSGYDVIAVHGVDEKKGLAYFIAAPQNATQRYLYSVALNGKSAPVRISPAADAGTHTYQFSPDLQWAVHTYSNMETPPVTRIVQMPDHKAVRLLEENNALREKLKQFQIAPVHFFKTDIGGGVLLDGYSIQSATLDTTRKHPLFYYIYGEPAIQTVLDQWNGRSYLWYQFLAQKGYVVMSVDNRGTPSPRGRNWRKIIYGQLGWLAANDHAAATRALLQKHAYLDPKRVGIYGHSGGGQMSLNLIFRYPELYALAMPSSFVSNQRYYHPAYQERFMGLPQDNPEGYEKGSPIHWAKQLQGKLLIIHGTGDSNVHYQTFEALINELVNHKKQFSMMAYPNRNHGLTEGATTQYHLFELRTNFLMTNMPPGGR